MRCISVVPSIEQSAADHRMKKWSRGRSRRKIICLPVTQIEKFECGTIGPRLHPASITQQLLTLPAIADRSNLPSALTPPINSLTDRLYSVMSPEWNDEGNEDEDDQQAFNSIVHWDKQQHYQFQHPCPALKTNQVKLQYMHLLENAVPKTRRGRQYPILTDEIDMIEDPNACTIMNKWAFADLVETERQKFVTEADHPAKVFRKRPAADKNIRICLRKRPLTEFEENIFKEVDIISVVDGQNIVLHIPSITVDNQVFIKNRKFRCDQTFDELTQMSTIYHSTLAPLVDCATGGDK